MNVEVVIVAYGSPDLLDSAIATLGGCAPVTVVDNGRDDAAEAVALKHNAKYVRPDRNLGFAAGVNRGVAALPDDDADVLLLNPDAICTPEAVLALTRALHASAKTACVAPQLFEPDGTHQRVRWPFPSPAAAWWIALGFGAVVDRAQGFLVGAVLLINRRALAEVGGFDESFFLYAEETDWQKRAADAGWARILVPAATAMHVGAATSSNTDLRELRFAAGQEHYITKWFGKAGARRYRAAVACGALIRCVALRDAAARRYARRRVRIAIRGAESYARDASAIT